MKEVKKSVFSANTRKKTVFFDTFSPYPTVGEGILAAAESKNCDCTNGRLRTGLGMRILTDENGMPYDVSTVAGEVRKSCRFYENNEDGTSAEKTGVFTRNGLFYLWDVELQEFVYVGDVHSYAKPHVARGEDAEIVNAISCSDGVYCYDGGTIGRTEIERTYCGAHYLERLFVACPFGVIAYSAPGKPLDFASSIYDGGRIYLHPEKGDPVEMCVFQGALYVFYQYGVLKIEGAGAGEDFQLTQIAYHGGKIFRDSVAVFKDRIYLLASDGVYRFDGKVFEKGYEEMKITPNASQDNYNWAVCEDLFLLRMQTAEGKRRTLVLHENGKDGYFADYLYGLHDFHGEARFCWNGYVYKLERNGEFPDTFVCSFTTAPLDFSVAKRKLLRKLRLEGDGEVSLTIVGDGFSKSADVVFENGLAEVDVLKRSKTFVLSFTLKKDAEIRKISADIEWL